VFAAFTSVDAIWGAAGRGEAAAADARLHALAARRRSEGRPASCVASGVWDGDLPPGLTREHLDSLGLRPMPLEEALTAILQAASADEADPVIADVDWARFAPRYTAARSGALLRGLPEAAIEAAAEAERSPAATELLARLAGADDDGRERLLADLVALHLATVLGTDPADVSPVQPFQQLGLESMAAVELRNRLARATGLTLPATLVYDHPAPLPVARFLLEELAPALPGSGAALFADLDRLEASIAGAPAGDRERLAARLQGLLGLLGGTPPVGGATAHDEEFASASVDELLDLIEQEFGKN
jgi:acyl carrier protein